jgi:hypothetical protein
MESRIMRNQISLCLLLASVPLMGHAQSVFPKSSDLTKHGVSTISKWPKRTVVLDWKSFLSKVGTTSPIRDEKGYDEVKSNLPYYRVELFRSLIEGKVADDEQARRSQLMLIEFPHPDSTSKLITLSKVDSFRMRATAGLSMQTLRIKWNKFTQAEVLAIRKLAADKDVDVAKFAADALENLRRQKKSK